MSDENGLPSAEDLDRVDEENRIRERTAFGFLGGGHVETGVAVDRVLCRSVFVRKEDVER